MAVEHDGGKFASDVNLQHARRDVEGTRGPPMLLLQGWKVVGSPMFSVHHNLHEPRSESNA